MDWHHCTLFIDYVVPGPTALLHCAFPEPAALLHSVDSVVPGPAPSSAGGEGAGAADEQGRGAGSLQPAGLPDVGAEDQEQQPHPGGGKSQTPHGGDGTGQTHCGFFLFFFFSLFFFLQPGFSSSLLNVLQQPVV